MAKSRRFPIAGERAQIGAMGTELQSEQAFLLDPCLDDPSVHLVFDDTGQVGSSTERGQCTIETLALNREALVLARRAAIDEAKMVSKTALAGDFYAGIEYLKQHLTGASPYLAAKRQALAVWMKQVALGAFSSLAPEMLAAFLPEHERPAAASLTRDDVGRHKVRSRAGSKARSANQSRAALVQSKQAILEESVA